MFYQFFKHFASCTFNLKVLHFLQDIVAILSDDNCIYIAHHLLSQSSSFFLHLLFFGFNILHVPKNLSVKHFQRRLVGHVVRVLRVFWLPKLFHKEVL